MVLHHLVVLMHVHASALLLPLPAPSRDYLRQKAGALRRHASAVADGLRAKIAESKVGGAARDGIMGWPTAVGPSYPVPFHYYPCCGTGTGQLARQCSLPPDRRQAQQTRGPQAL